MGLEAVLITGVWQNYARIGLSEFVAREGEKNTGDMETFFVNKVLEFLMDCLRPKEAERT